VALIRDLGLLAARAIATGPPLTPDGDEARQLAEQELADPVYQAAEPTLIDRIARAIAEFFEQLFSTELDGGWASGFALVAGIVLVVLIVAAFIVWGVPRAQRSAPAAVGGLFDQDETRSAAQLRAAAASHADRGEWDAAIILRFRALARGTIERGAVDTPPGATVHTFARTAAAAFPASAVDLERAAAAFDDVRYLRLPGSAELYRMVADVDDRVAASRPVSPDWAAAPA
jgi:hypothetical protein